MRRLVLCLAVAIILASSAQTVSPHNIQWTLESVDLTLGDAGGADLDFSLDESRQDTGWSLDKSISLSGGVREPISGYESLGLLQTGTRIESSEILLPDTRHIGDTRIWLDFGGHLDYKGIQSRKNSSLMGGKVEHAQDPEYGIFFGAQIPFSLTSKP